MLQCQGQGVLVVGLGHDLAWRGLAARLALRLRLRYKSKILHQTQIFVGNEMKPPSSHPRLRLRRDGNGLIFVGNESSKTLHQTQM